MPETLVFRFAGPTFGISSVAVSGVGPFTVSASPTANHAAFYNPSLAPCVVSVCNINNANPPGPVIPSISSGPVQVFIVPAQMTMPMVVNTPAGGFKFNAGSLSTVASQLYVTPVEDV